MSSQQTRKRSPLLFRAILLVASMALVLSGCGGGGGDEADPAPRGIGGGGVKGPLANAVATATLFDASQPPNADVNGTDTFTVQVDDGTGNTDTIDVTVNIAPVNDAPTIGGTAPDGEVGVAYSFTPTSDDTEGDTLTFTAANLPSWANIIGTTGEIAGTPDAAGVQIDITITVADDGVQSESADLGPFSITINPATAVDDLSGVYKLTETTTDIQRLESGTATCYDNELVGDVERMYITVSQTGINLIAMSADPFGGQPTGTVDSANDTFTLALSESYSENGWDFTESFILTDGTYDLVAGTFSGTITETETGVDTNNGVNNYDCSRTTNLTADFVYRHNGTEDYNGVYGIEYRGSDNIQAGDQDRGTIPVEIVINGNSFMPFVAGAHPNTVYSDVSFDPNTGFFAFTESFYDLDDLDGDGFVDDIQCSSTMIGGIFVRAPDDAGGLPVISLSAEGTDKEFNDQVNPAVCSDPGAIPDWSDDSWTEMYGKRLTTEDYTLRVTSAVSDGATEDLHIMGLLNPPMRTTTAGSMLRAEVYDATGTVLLCSRAYDQGGFRIVSRLPHADFDTEAFQDGFYSFASCDTNQNDMGTPLVDGGNYVVKIMDDMGTADGGVDDQMIVSQNAVAQLALPVADRISRRDVDLNGVVSSGTERDRVIGLYGFFNPYQAMTATFPGVPDADGYHFDFDSTESPERKRVSSSTPTVTIPAGVINEWDGPSELRVWSVHDDGPRRAVSWSRYLGVWAGMNGFFTVETNNLDLILGKFALQVISDGSNVTCVVPTFTGLSCNPLQPGESGFTANAIDWANNRVSLTLYDLENGGVPIPTTLTFTDSGNATVTMGASTGVARAVNPELMVRSQLTEGGLPRTVISFGNAPAVFLNADVSLLGGTFEGEGDSFALWDDTVTSDGNDYMDAVDAYLQFPFDDGKAQRVGSYASTRAHLVSVADTVTATFTNDRLGIGLPPMTFSLDYTVLDPTAVAVPVRADITVHLDDGTSFTGDTATSLASAHDLGAAAVTSVSWISTLPADTLWVVRARLSDPATGDAFKYGEFRSEPLGQATSLDLDFDGTDTWTWTAPPDIDLSLGVDELARLDLRTMDPARTMQGDTRSIFSTSSTGGDGGGGGAVLTPDSSGSTSGTVTLSGTDTAIFGTLLDTGFVGAFLATAVQPDHIIIVDSSSTLEVTADINNGFTIVVTDDSPGFKGISMAIVKDGTQYDYTCITPKPDTTTWTIDCGGVNSINFDIGNRTVIFSNTLVSNQDTGAILTIDGTLTW
ncbi:MAG: hypothetical protein DIZ77_00025 [endosymbiont of Seepiophila jonesi]|uniref:Dystroglycan-type cadherin-like domain-containing protein n=1 Tax=endosymbiont of Lamellibrachia luymesi TaxID=2200907 RepID=A0A370DWR1_9GAMM|nr:MAG: hypothetical protein DIZ79_09345 [endosymbiont of Lamellibrachia luymesi]RDH94642.1 MAG: hypothetical protein DIZ77_00025 [endosymbiont of Seepiophila jonesi]